MPRQVGLKDDVAAHLIDLPINSNAGTTPPPARDRKDRVVISCEHFVADKVKAHVCRGGSVKIKCRDRFAHVAAELVPQIGLGENALTERLGYKPTVALLRDRENKVVHGWRLR